MARTAAALLLLLAVHAPLSAANLYWNGATNSASPAAGGTGNWNTSNNWRSGSDTGSQATWSSGDNATLAGTAGTITINTSTVSAGTVTINTTGYIITSTAASRGLAATSLVLAAGKNLEFNMNTTGGGSGVWALGGITFGSGASLIVSGTASASNANRVDLNVASSTITGGSITLAGTGAGATGFVATASGVTLNTNITNNSATSATMLGASSGNSLTYGGTLSGSAGLLFAAGASGGAGTITLNAANSYLGATTFNAANSGTLKLGITNALSTVSDVTMAASASNGGILDLNGFDQEIASLTSGAGGGSITNNASGTAANTLTISGSATPAAFGLVISDGTTRKTALVRSGTGSTTLSNTSTFTGGTTVSGGTLVLGHATNTLANTGAVLVSGGTLGLGANSDTVGAVTLSSGSITGSGGVLTASSYALQSGSVTATLAGSGTVTKTTSGIVTLATGNTFTGKTTISGGFIAGSGESIFGANPGSFTADQITLNGGGIKSTGAINFSSNRGMTLGASGGTFDTTGGTITLSNVVTGSGALTKAGAGTLILDNVHTYTGGTNVNAGTVQFGSGNIIPDTGAVTIAGGTLDLQSHNETVGAVTVSSGSIIGNGGTLTGSSFDIASAGAVTVSNADAIRTVSNATIVNAGSITASGTGSNDGIDGIDGQTNTGINVTNSGSIQGARHGITGGDNSLALGSYAISVTNQTNGTLTGSNGSGINIDGVKNTYVATITNNGTITGSWDGVSASGDGDGVDVDGVIDLTNNGIIRGLSSSGSGSMPEGLAFGGGTVVNNAGAVITGGALNGTGIEGHGILVDDSSGGSAIAATMLTNSGTIRGYTGYGIKLIGTFADTITNNASGTIRGAGTGAALQTGDGGDTITNRGAITSDIGNAIDLEAGNDSLIIEGGAASITGNVSGGAGTNTFTLNPGTGNSFSYSGTISNFSSVTVQSGSVILSGANTYTGSTILNGGNLQVGQTGSGKTGTGNVTVNGSGTVLSGTGTVDGATTSVILGIIKPGDSGGTSTGTLNTNTLIFTPVSSTTVAEMQIVSNAAFDVLNITGDITFNSSSNIFVNGSGYTAHVGDSFTLIDWSGVVTLGGFSTGTNLRTGANVAGNEGNLDLPDITGTGFWQIGSLADGGALTFSIVAVPEPARGMFMLIGGLWMALRRRRING